MIGVLHVGTLTERAFDDEDVELLQRAGDRAALAISSRLTERERGLADALQRQPHPATSGAARRWRSRAATCPRHRPSSAATGTTPSRFRTARSEWRSATWSAAASTPPRSWDSCAAGCAPTRSTAWRRARCSSGSAACCASSSPAAPPRSSTWSSTRTAASLVVASAGHPPPLVIAGESGRPEFVELPGSAPLGATRHATYERREHPLEPGSTLVLYTDGLVERAGESLDAGLERLTGVVDGTYRRPRAPRRRASWTCCCRRARRATTPRCSWRAPCRSSDTLVAQLPAEVESIPVMRRLLGRWLRRGRRHPGRGRRTSRWRAPRRPRTRSSTRTASRPGASRCARRSRRAARQWWPSATSATGAPPRGTHRGRGLLLMEGLTDAVEVMRGDDGTTVRAVAAPRSGGGVSDRRCEVDYRDSSASCS